MKSSRYELKKKYAILTIEWCKNNMGIRKTKKKELTLKFSDKDGYITINYKRKKEFKRKYPIQGSYCHYRNLITIYEPNCKTIKDVVSTIIHEYTHYLQSMYQYEKFEKIYFYSQNPLEKEALNNEEKYTNKCIKEVRLIINNI
jgi:hypothetical protein